MATFKLCGGAILPTVDCPTLPTDSEIPCATDCPEGCGCPTPIPSAPQPYYSLAPTVQQSNCDPTCVNIYNASLRFALAWNIPACGATAVTKVSNLQSLAIGSNLWIPGKGYFEVTAFDPTTLEITIKNNCIEGNIAPGTVVPKCTEFIVSPPPCCEGGSGDNPLLYPYVAIDFTAQGLGVCQEITVTTVNGMSVGKNIQIGSGVYRVGAVGGPTLITICNDGAGIAPGSSVIARTSSGSYQYPVIVIDTNPCSATKVNEGSVLVCKDGIIQPLTGIAVGAQLTLTDATTGEAEYRITGNPSFTCTILTQTLTLAVGQASYTITVADSSVFVNGDVTQIGSRTDRLTITSLPDATHVIGTLNPVPGSIQLIPIGTTICDISCCEAIDAKVDFLNSNLAIKRSTVTSAQISPIPTVITPTGIKTTPTPTLSVTNNAQAAHNLNLVICLDVGATFELEGMFDDPAKVSLFVELEINGGGLVDVAHVVRPYFYKINATITLLTEFVSISLTDVVPPGTTSIYGVKGVILFESTGAGTMRLSSLLAKMEIMGVSV